MKDSSIGTPAVEHVKEETIECLEYSVLVTKNLLNLLLTSALQVFLSFKFIS